eukprot:scaffold1050_cov130-Isochrysis_galbana.AAC.7
MEQLPADARAAPSASEPNDIVMPPTRWGRGFKGPRRECFPLPDEYALGADEIPLDQITVLLNPNLLFHGPTKNQTPPMPSGVGKKASFEEGAMEHHSLEIQQLPSAF